MKKKEGKMFGELLDLTRDNEGRLHILEEKIPVDEQFEYFNYSKEARQNAPRFLNRNDLVARLFNPELPLEEKRHCLSLLAGLPDVGAYRAIETYHSSPPETELANWSALALVESRILLNSELTGEQQVFISTGLGGHDGKLRYFCLVASRGKQLFTELQHQIIEREFGFQFATAKVDVEKSEHHEDYASFLILAHLSVDVKELLDAIVAECNQYGDFIRPQVVITNMKILTDEEIRRNIDQGISPED